MREISGPSGEWRGYELHGARIAPAQDAYYLSGFGGLELTDSLPEELRHHRNGAVVDGYFGGLTNTEPEIIPGTWIYGGPIVNAAFGHFLAESVHRILPAIETWGTEIPFLFCGLGRYPNDGWLKASPFSEILEWLGVDPLTMKVVFTYSQVEKLLVVPQGTSWNAPVSSEYLNLLTRNMLKQQGSLPSIPRADKIFVTRINMQDGSGLLGEGYIADCLARDNFTIVHPQDWPFPVQQRMYLNAREAIFTEGSAIHTLEILGGEVFERSATLVRRDKKIDTNGTTFEYVLGQRSAEYYETQARFGTLAKLLQREGYVRWEQRGVAFTPVESLISTLCDSGLSTLPGFSAEEYLRAVEEDFLAYVKWTASRFLSTAWHDALDLWRSLTGDSGALVDKDIESRIRDACSQGYRECTAPQPKDTDADAVALVARRIADGAPLRAEDASTLASIASRLKPHNKALENLRDETHALADASSSDRFGGKLHPIDRINRVLDIMQATRYLELGWGHTYWLPHIKCAYKVGVATSNNEFGWAAPSMPEIALQRNGDELVVTFSVESDGGAEPKYAYRLLEGDQWTAWIDLLPGTCEASLTFEGEQISLVARASNTVGVSPATPAATFTRNHNPTQSAVFAMPSDLPAKADVSEVEHIASTADDYFRSAQHAPFDVIVIDGPHDVEQVFRDFCNSQRFAHPRTVWVIDDTFPTSAASSVPSWEELQKIREIDGIKDTSWHGEAYKAVLLIRLFFPNYCVQTVRSQNGGQTLIWTGETRAKPLGMSVEDISRMDYLQLLQNQEALCLTTDEALLESLQLAFPQAAQEE